MVPSFYNTLDFWLRFADFLTNGIPETPFFTGFTVLFLLDSIPVSRSEQKERISNRISSFLFKREPGEVHAKRFAEPLAGTTCAFLRAGPDESKRTHGSLITSVFDLRADDSATARHEYFASAKYEPARARVSPPKLRFALHISFLLPFFGAPDHKKQRMRSLSAFTLLFPFSTFLFKG